MKRLVATWSLCLLMLAGSFGVLVFEDRQLNLPLPYSIPIAFTATLAMAPLLLVVARLAPARRQAPVAEPPAATATASPRTVRRQVPQGVVLLDFSAARGAQRRAA